MQTKSQQPSSTNPAQSYEQGGSKQPPVQSNVAGLPSDMQNHSFAASNNFQIASQAQQLKPLQNSSVPFGQNNERQLLGHHSAQAVGEAADILSQVMQQQYMPSGQSSGQQTLYHSQIKPGVINNNLQHSSTQQISIHQPFQQSQMSIAENNQQHAYQQNQQFQNQQSLQQQAQRPFAQSSQSAPLMTIGSSSQSANPNLLLESFLQLLQLLEHQMVQLKQILSQKNGLGQQASAGLALASSGQQIQTQFHQLVVAHEHLVTSVKLHPTLSQLSFASSLPQFSLSTGSGLSAMMLGSIQPPLLSNNMIMLSGQTSSDLYGMPNMFDSNQLVFDTYGLRPNSSISKANPIYVKYFLGGVLYSTKENDIENHFKKSVEIIGNTKTPKVNSPQVEIIDVAVIRDKHSGKSRGFAFVTFVIFPMQQEVDDARFIAQQKLSYAEQQKVEGEEGNKLNGIDRFVIGYLHDNCRAALELKRQMLDKPHLIHGRHVEIRLSDGEKPMDSFIAKKNGADGDSDKQNEKEKGKEKIDVRRKRGDNNQSQKQDQNRRRQVRRDRDNRRGRRSRSNNKRGARSSQSYSSHSSDYTDSYDDSRSSSREDRRKVGDDRQRKQIRRSRSRSEGRGRRNDVKKPQEQPKQQSTFVPMGQKGQDYDQNRYEREIAKLQDQAYAGIRDKVFIGGLDYSLSESAFKAHFARYGEVKEYQIIKDPVSKSSRGFGFVRFYDEDVAKHLITQVQITYINGRRCDMRTADIKSAADRSTTQSRPQQEIKSRNGPSSGNRQNRSVQRQETESLQNSIMIPPAGSSTIPEYSWQQKAEEQNQQKQQGNPEQHSRGQSPQSHHSQQLE